MQKDVLVLTINKGKKHQKFSMTKDLGVSIFSEPERYSL